MILPLSMRPDELTQRAAAAACGIDLFTFRRLMQAGRGPAHRVVRGVSPNVRPDARGCYAIRRSALWGWIARPDVWPYVRRERMGDPLLRHLFEQAQRASRERWWTTAELAGAHCVVPDIIIKWRAAGWPTGGRWLRVEGRRGLLWWDKAAAPPPPPDRRFRAARKDAA